ncbi:SGNH/GDSL hydrolase family protein [Kitasatospora sp. GP82]|uniref:SGNH/GDSL hydrolase family protein n=1 Tax=Kitasatospora sp. GP82 TaxID=3035089 RepID=UPI0024735308|nr:SGNH/GDSL hydrolase family protein [Kitasatospora sp. GP82]MDH6123926.1 lysophospholipase L1-like esterase [Kitasatospora sp. GP82]
MNNTTTSATSAASTEPAVGGAHRSFAGYVAVGDSFTEGMCDELLPDGQFRGWADRVAAALAAERPGEEFRYANLAVRGKLIGQICAEQVDRAAAMRADLVTLAGGLNDVLRPGCDIAEVERLLGRAATGLLDGNADGNADGKADGGPGAGCGDGPTVVMFTSTDPTRRLAGSARLLPAILEMKSFVEGLARRYPNVLVVDLFSAPCFDDRRMWAEDRLHLSPEGHRRVAAAVLEALGRPAGFDWRAPLPPAEPRSRGERLGSDLRWLRIHLGPWIGRRLTGRSSGDNRPPKRAELLPYEG